MNSCVNKSFPCRTLQAVLDKCPNVADIYVISSTLIVNDGGCFVTSNKSYTISSAQDEHIQVICTQGRHSSKFLYYENVCIICQIRAMYCIFRLWIIQFIIFQILYSGK